MAERQLWCIPQNRYVPCPDGLDVDKSPYYEWHENGKPVPKAGAVVAEPTTQEVVDAPADPVVETPAIAPPKGGIVNKLFGGKKK